MSARKGTIMKTILFDLDGTLLPMDQEVFVYSYFKRLAAKVAPLGYDPQQLAGAIWKGTEVMVRNDGSRTNEEAFWQFFEGIYGAKALQDKPVFDEFYSQEFQQVQQDCGYTPRSRELIHALQQRGHRLVLATNPVFPAVATQSRIRWAGLQPEDFELYTTYENSSFCKPNLRYYESILQKIGCQARECIMVGNDVEEDMIAQELGMDVFLLTDCLINSQGKDINTWPHGGFEELQKFLAERA